MLKKPKRLIFFKIEFPYNIDILKTSCEGHLEENTNTAFFSKVLLNYLTTSGNIAVAPWEIRKDIRKLARERKVLIEDLISKAFYRWQKTMSKGYSAEKATAHWRSKLGLSCRMLRDLVQDVYPKEILSEIAIEAVSAHIRYDTYLAFLSVREQELIKYIQEGSILVEL